jgi:transcriptional regulator of arginine metabolism
MHAVMYSMHELVQKSERQKLIVDIVGATPVGRQSQLVSLLRNNGFSVTQASISRDLEELGIQKVQGVYRVNSARMPAAFGFLSFNPSGDSLIVARCSSGLASALAVQIDAKHLGGVVGTIAGDDTVFIAVVDNSIQNSLLRQLRKDFDAST